jgi:hypothetical protein
VVFAHLPFVLEGEIIWTDSSPRVLCTSQQEDCYAGTTLLSDLGEVQLSGRDHMRSGCAIKDSLGFVVGIVAHVE